MSRNQQLERTKSDILSAVLTLLERKPLDKISIADIAAEAKINRATFYLHFMDKYDALGQLVDAHLEPLREILTAIHGFSQRQSLEKMDRMFETFSRENGPVLRKLMGVQSPYFALRQRLYDFFSAYTGQVIPEACSELEQEMLAGMLTNFFIYYLNHDSPESFVTTLYQSYQNLTLMFFRVSDQDAARQSLEKLIEEHAWGYANQN